MKLILLAIISLISEICVAQKRIPSNDSQSLIHKVLKNVYGKKFVKRIEDWRKHCYCIPQLNRNDTIHIYIEYVPWEAYYCELIQIGDSLNGFTMQYLSNTLSCVIDRRLYSLHKVLNGCSNSDTIGKILTRDEAEEILDFSFINVITIIRRNGKYHYDSKSIYFEEINDWQ